MDTNNIYLIVAFIVLFGGAYAYYYQNYKRFSDKRISGSELENYSFDDALVVDVRSREEYQTGHLKNAVNIPYLAMRQGTRALDQLKDKKIVLYSTTDTLSKNAFGVLKLMGFNQLYIGEVTNLYDYDLVSYPVVLMNDFKGRLLEDGVEPLNIDEERAMNTEYNISDEALIDFMDDSTLYGLFSKNSKKAIDMAKRLDREGHKIFLLVEEFSQEGFKKELNKEDYELLNSKVLQEEFCSS